MRLGRNQFIFTVFLLMVLILVGCDGGGDKEATYEITIVIKEGKTLLQM